MRSCFAVARRGGALCCDKNLSMRAAIRKRASCMPFLSGAQSANFNIEQRAALSLGVSSPRRTIHMHMNFRSLAKQRAEQHFQFLSRRHANIYKRPGRRVISAAGRPRCIAISAKCTWPNHFSYSLCSAPIVRLPSIKKHVICTQGPVSRRQICQTTRPTFIRGPNLSNILSADRCRRI